MHKRIIWAITSKDLRAITSNKQIMIALIILPIILCVIMPAVVIIFGKSLDIASLAGVDMITMLINNLPAGDLKSTLEALPSEKHKVIYMFINYMLLPLFMIIPTMVAMMTAANSFVGEKERRTLESLLFAPIKIKELFVGKVLASFIPATIITFGSFILCGVVIDVLTYSMYNRLIFPTTNWILMIFLIVPVLTLFTILFNVMISARVKGFQEAQQLGGLVVLPIIALLLMQVTGLFLLSPFIIGMIGLGLFILSVLLLHQIAKMNQRNVLFERQVH